MWIKASGEITERVAQITTAASSHFLFTADQSALVDAGVSALSERLQEELLKFLGSQGRLDYLLLTHAHFDHLGCLPYLRERYPALKLVCGATTAKVLGDEEKLKYFFERNKQVAEAFDFKFKLELASWLKCFTPDVILGDGDELNLGAELRIKLISVPGHTEDSVAYFAPSETALAAGEAVGSFNGRDKLAACFEFSYRDYLLSLEKIQKLDVKYLSLAHLGCLTGDIVAKFLLESTRSAESFSSAVKERLAAGELVTDIQQSIIVEWTSQNICPDGPFVEDQERIISNMVSLVAEGK